MPSRRQTTPGCWRRCCGARRSARPPSRQRRRQSRCWRRTRLVPSWLPPMSPSPGCTPRRPMPARRWPGRSGPTVSPRRWATRRSRRARSGSSARPGCAVRPRTGGRSSRWRCHWLPRPACTTRPLPPTARLVWFGAMHRQFDYYDQHAADGLAFCAEHDLTVHELDLLGSRCVELVHRGRWDQADEVAADLLRRLPRSRADRIQPLYLLGRVRARRGERPWDVLDEALAIAAPRNELQHVGNVRAVRAEAAWLEGRLDAAAAEAAEAYELALAAQDPWILRRARPVAVARRALDSLPDVVEPHPYGLQIRGDWAAAAQLWERLGCPFEQAAALLDSDEEPALRTALAIFAGLRAQPCAAMAARKLHRMGVRDVPRGPQAATRQHSLGLTRREAQVLELLGTAAPTPRSRANSSCPARPSATMSRPSWPSSASALARRQPASSMGRRIMLSAPGQDSD